MQTSQCKQTNANNPMQTNQCRRAGGRAGGRQQTNAGGRAGRKAGGGQMGGRTTLYVVDQPAKRPLQNKIETAKYTQTNEKYVSRNEYEIVTLHMFFVCV